MPFQEPTNVFFSSLDAKTAVFHLANGSFRAVACYFDNAFLDANAGETKMDTTAPRIICPALSVYDIERDTIVSVAGREWSVVQVQPDGTGMAIVTLAHE